MGIIVKDAIISRLLIDNGSFSGAAPEWGFGTDWSLSSNKALLSSVGSAGNLQQKTLAFDFSKALSYDVTFTITDYIGGEVFVKLFNDLVEVANLGSFTSNGTFTVSSGILTANCDSIVFEPTVVAQSMFFDDVSAILNVEDSGFDLRTDCFQLAESHDCTVKLSGTNLDNAFGIDFLGLSYTPIIRISAELEAAKYDGDKENEEDSAGISKTLYFKSEKKQNLFIYQQPDHLHDFLRLLIGYDTFKVDDIDYVSLEATYEIESERLLSKLQDLNNANTDLRLKTDLNENRFC